jgi:hypothetical protein
MAITKPGKTNKGRKRNSDTTQLKGAVRALGGDEQDIELLRGIESDEEAASGSKKNGAKGQVSVCYYSNCRDY